MSTKEEIRSILLSPIGEILCPDAHGRVWKAIEAAHKEALEAIEAARQTRSVASHKRDIFLRLQESAKSILGIEVIPTLELPPLPGEEHEAWLKEFGVVALTPGFDPERARAYQRGQKSEVDSE